MKLRAYSQRYRWNYKSLFSLQNVSPDSTKSCGPYKPLPEFREKCDSAEAHDIRGNHDTVGMIAVDHNGDLAVATSTNGASHKVPGLVPFSLLLDYIYGGIYY